MMVIFIVQQENMGIVIKDLVLVFVMLVIKVYHVHHVHHHILLLVIFVYLKCYVLMIVQHLVNVIIQLVNVHVSHIVKVKIVLN